LNFLEEDQIKKEEFIQKNLKKLEREAEIFEKNVEIRKTNAARFPKKKYSGGVEPKSTEKHMKINNYMVLNPN
jgi:hypothetical protein